MQVPLKAAIQGTSQNRRQLLLQPTCVELSSQQAARDLAEVCQHLEEQGSMPGQARGESADGNDYGAVLAPELPALSLPLPHELCI